MPDKPAQRIGLVESVLLLGASLALLALGGGVLQLELGLGGLALTEILAVLAPTCFAAWAFARSSRGGARRVLGLAWPGGRALVGGALAGAGGFYVVAAVVEGGLERFAPVPPALREELRRLIVPPGGPRPFLVDLVALALLPAICEELLFRGALLEAWKPFGRSGAIGGTALAFGVFHLQPYKLLPTAVLGALAGAVAWRSRSVAPAMVLHAVNNTLVIALVRAGHDEPPPVWTPLGALLLAAAVTALWIGAGLLRQPARETKFC